MLSDVLGSDIFTWCRGHYFDLQAIDFSNDQRSRGARIRLSHRVSDVFPLGLGKGRGRTSYEKILPKDMVMDGQ